LRSGSFGQAQFVGFDAHQSLLTEVRRSAWREPGKLFPRRSIALKSSQRARLSLPDWAVWLFVDRDQYVTLSTV
jgi:hypothetical protein